jgi:hypothetical protein
MSKLTLSDYLKPGLEPGTYTIEAKQTVAVEGAPTPSASQKFTVQGPRFTLDPSEIHAVYPPANASGPFAQTLAHVVLSTRTLPWERRLVGLAEGVPWLALLVFDAAELADHVPPGPNGGGPQPPTGVVTMTVDALLTADTGVLVPDLKSVSPKERKLQMATGEPRDRTCQALQIPLALFRAVAPRPKELPYLAHVRNVDTSDQPGADADEAGDFALVVANRFPAAAAGGVRGIAHLVSLEGHEALLAGTARTGGADQVRLVSLASWSFTATPDTDEAGESFKQLALGLAKPRQGERRDLALGLPFDQEASSRAKSPPPAGDPRRLVADRLDDGYVPVSYHLSTGQNTLAWYRGPLTPRQAEPVDESARPFPSSSAALIYDRNTGMFDVSLATAWEIGRAIALADRKFTTELIRFTRGAHRLVDLVLAGLQSKHLDTPDDLKEIAKSGLIEQRFLERLKAGLAGHVAAVSKGAPAAPTPPSATAADLPPDPVAAVKALLARDDLRALVAEEVADDLKPIAAWLARLMLLEQVPFAYLVAHPQLLPVESARFFSVDQNWIGTLLDGALSVGVQSSRDSWFQQVVQQIAPDAARDAALALRGHDAGTRSDPLQAAGLLVRSALVAGWPALTVQASEKGKESALLRTELLAPSVLLCLFDGLPDTVRLRAPHQSLHFALEDGEHHLRQLTANVGTPINKSIKVNAALYRSGAGRVLNIVGGGDDLVTRLAKALGQPLGPAGFALQMLYAPEQISFRRP